MSKFRTRIRDIGRAPGGMGFAAIARAERPRHVIVVAEAASADEEEVVLREQHDAAGAALVKLRTLTRGYEVPADACPSYRELLVGLEALEQDLHRHVHLENNVLFGTARSR